MDQPQSGSLPTLESNIDQLLQELDQLATRVKLPDPHAQRDDTTQAQGQFLVASGRS